MLENILYTYETVGVCVPMCMQLDQSVNQNIDVVSESEALSSTCTHIMQMAL